MMKKRIIIAAVLAVVLLLATVSYAVFVRPLLKSEETPAYQNGTFLLFDKVGRENISSIEVHNASGEYTLRKQKAEDGSESLETFVIEGYEDISLSAMSVSSLVVSAGSPRAFQCLTEDASEEELQTYGLAEPQAYWILTDTDGTTYRVEVGDRLLSGGGYYCRYMDQEGSIYVINSTIEDSILRPVTVYVDPVLCSVVNPNDYYMADELIVFKGDEMFVDVVQSEKEEFVNPDANIETHIEYPRKEKTNDTVFNSAMYSLISLTGTETVYVGDFESEESAETLAGYGMDDPYYEVEFLYKNTLYVFFISELQDDGYYYAMSGTLSGKNGEDIKGFSYVVRCAPDSLSWLEKDFDYWVSDYEIQFPIVNINSLGIEHGDRSMTFYLSHSVDDDGNAMIRVTNGEGFTIDDESAYIFRKFYITLLTMQKQGMSGLSPEEIEEIKSDESAHMLTVTVTLNDGAVYEYSVYRYTTGRALLTVNGEGDFYIYPDWAEKTVNDLDRLLNFEWIDPYAKN